MRRLKGLALVIVALVAAGVAAGALVREFWPLPRLVDRTETRVFADTGDTPLGRAIEPLARRHPGLTGIHPLADAVEAFAARISLARAATRSIDVQYYIWHGDLTGNILFNELLAAADRGMRVRLLLDYGTHSREVADPWYTGNFEATWNDVNIGCNALLEKISSAAE